MQQVPHILKNFLADVPAANGEPFVAFRYVCKLDLPDDLQIPPNELATLHLGWIHANFAEVKINGNVVAQFGDGSSSEQYHVQSKTITIQQNLLAENPISLEVIGFSSRMRRIGFTSNTPNVITTDHETFASALVPINLWDEITPLAYEWPSLVLGLALVLAWFFGARSRLLLFGFAYFVSNAITMFLTEATVFLEVRSLVLLNIQVGFWHARHFVFLIFALEALGLFRKQLPSAVGAVLVFFPLSAVLFSQLGWSHLDFFILYRVCFIVAMFIVSIYIFGFCRDRDLPIVILGSLTAFIFCKDVLHEYLWVQYAFSGGPPFHTVFAVPVFIFCFVFYRQLQEENRHRQIILEHEKRLATQRAVKRTVEMLAHDIRAPFSMAKNLVDSVLQAKDLNSVQRLAQIFQKDFNQTVGFVDGMLTEVLSLGKARNLSLDLVDPREIVCNSLRICLASYKGELVRFDYQWRHQNMIRVDRASFQRVLVNIISNALDAVSDKPNSRIWFEVGERSDGVTDIVVGNSNSLIPDDIRESIFDVFVTSGKRKGTGLGLAIAKQIVEAHDGSIECLSDARDGTRFLIFLKTASDSRVRDDVGKISFPVHS